MTDTMAISVVPDFAIGPEEAKARFEQFKQFVREQMTPGIDYGIIPGTTKPTLLKPGAQKIANLFGLAVEQEIITRIEEWHPADGAYPLFHYHSKTRLRSMRTGLVVAEGEGSANNYAAHYRYRDQARGCPSCGAEAIIKGKAEFGGGWFCWKKRGGCGAKYADDAPAIQQQTVGRVENDDPYSQVNTILKMAHKSSLVEAALMATRASGLFSQDLEDADVVGTVEGTVVTPSAASAPQPSPPPRALQGVANEQKIIGKVGCERLLARLASMGRGEQLPALMVAVDLVPDQDPAQLTVAQAQRILALAHRWVVEAQDPDAGALSEEQVTGVPS